MRNIFHRMAVTAGLRQPLWSYCALLLVSAVVGCQSRTVPTSDLEQATKLITATLDDWRAGDSLGAQRDKSPPVYVAEELWLNGERLEGYELAGPGELFGTNVRFHVRLRCSRQSGPTRQREVNYLVTTTPACTIAREDR